MSGELVGANQYKSAFIRGENYRFIPGVDGEFVLGVIERGLNRQLIGLGMIPRGEVGLIFAGIGATLMLPNASGVIEPVISSAIFGAVVIMVIITTLITPIALKWSLGRKRTHKREG